jgi:hypothetical protein
MKSLAVAADAEELIFLYGNWRGYYPLLPIRPLNGAEKGQYPRAVAVTTPSKEDSDSANSFILTPPHAWDKITSRDCQPHCPQPFRPTA